MERSRGDRIRADIAMHDNPPASSFSPSMIAFLGAVMDTE